MKPPNNSNTHSHSKAALWQKKMAETTKKKTRSLTKMEALQRMTKMVMGRMTMREQNKTKLD